MSRPPRANLGRSNAEPAVPNVDVPNDTASLLNQRCSARQNRPRFVCVNHRFEADSTFFDLSP